MRDEWRILTQEAANNQRGIDVIQLRQRQANPRCRTRTLRIGAEILLTQAEINIVRAQAAHDATGQRHFFQCGVRAHRHSDLIATVILGNATQTVRHIIQRHIPFDFLPLATLLHHGLEQAFSTIQRFVRETVLIGNPALVNLFVIKRQYALDDITLDLNRQVGTGRVVWRHRFATLQFPGTCRVAERLGG